MGNLNEINMDNVKEDLKEIFKNVNDWLKFAEAKNAGVLAFSSGLIFIFLKLQINETNLFLLITYYGLITTSILAIILIFISLSPILNNLFNSNDRIKAGGNKNLYFFGHLMTFNTSEEFLKYLYYKNGSKYHKNEFEEDLANQIITNSRITDRKYKIFKMILNTYLYGFIFSILVSLLMCMIKSEFPNSMESIIYYLTFITISSIFMIIKIVI